MVHTTQKGMVAKKTVNWRSSSLSAACSPFALVYSISKSKLEIRRICCSSELFPSLRPRPHACVYGLAPDTEQYPGKPGQTRDLSAASASSPQVCGKGVGKARIAQ